MNSFLKKFGAFTLAEVLITLGVIGIVAAMTLPVLTEKLDERQKSKSCCNRPAV